MVTGTVFKYGDNVDTDVIIPARYLNAPSPAELATHCMEDIDATYATRVQKGDIMVGGWNFGCGSSREHAPIAIQASGAACVIAASFARIFYRNSSTSASPFWSAPRLQKPFRTATRSVWTLPPASSPMRPPARPSRPPPSPVSSTRSSNTAACCPI